MDKQLLDLLTEINHELKSVKSDVNSFKSEIKTDIHSNNSDMKNVKTEMHHRFDSIEAKLEDIGEKFELTNELGINEMEFILDKVNKMEKDIYILKNRNSN
ncbi:hypothetical protein [Alkalibacillus silvisoli]|uniref:DUF5082 domain-containing protein n=1 Tax=Alkalibacillus silvisoli TaxID=392823 RepID=A0ABP3JI86_9BACI